MTRHRYDKYLEGKEKKFETLCKRCGDCCGANDDPCQHLVKLDDATFFCKDYSRRLREQRTVTGKTFYCVPIREHIVKDTLRPGCAYRKVR